MNSLHDSLGPTFIHNLLVLSECSGLIVRFCRLSACTVLPQRHDVKTMSSMVYNNLVLAGLVLTPVSRLIYRRVHRCQQAGLDPTNANEIVFYNVKGERSFFFVTFALSLSIHSVDHQPEQCAAPKEEPDHHSATRQRSRRAPLPSRRVPPPLQRQSQPVHVHQRQRVGLVVAQQRLACHRILGLRKHVCVAAFVAAARGELSMPAHVSIQRQRVPGQCYLYINRK